MYGWETLHLQCTAIIGVCKRYISTTMLGVGICHEHRHLKAKCTSLTVTVSFMARKQVQIDHFYTTNCVPFSLHIRPEHLHPLIRRKVQSHPLTNQVNMALVQINRLPGHIHLPTTLTNEHQARSQNRLMSLLLPRPETGAEHIELLNGRRIHIRLPIHALIALLPRQDGVMRVVRLEGQRPRKEGHAIPLHARTEARVQHVVGARHALHYVALQVCVDAIRGHEDGIARSQGEVVHEQRGDEASVVAVAVLPVEACQHAGDVRVVAELGLRDALQRFDGLRYFFGRCAQ